MGKRGPKPKSAQAAELDGNAGHRPGATDLPSVPLATAPPAPDWLTDRGRQIWDEIAAELVSRSILTAADLGALALLAQSWDDFRWACDDINDNGAIQAAESGYESPRPAVSIKTQSAARILQVSQRFGLTPMDRVGMGGPGKPKSQNPNNPLGDMLGKK